ncbi:hypothetical protein [Lysobacter brunescens]|uniref:Uncharacterized protein n=1 Tax=Lysobacter brunescens TaxID=262323 RepID=A0ABW2Y8W4_9GAMM
MTARFFISLPDPDAVQAAGAFAFRSRGAEGIAGELLAALRTDALFQRWRATQEDPDAVDPAMAATDPGATVVGTQNDLHVELVVVSSISSSVLRHRLRLLAGHAWQLRDVTAA